MKKEAFDIFFNRKGEGVKYACSAEIHGGLVRSPRVEVECKSVGKQNMNFRCETSKKVDTIFGSVEMIGDGCELSSFELKKKLDPKDPGFVEEDGKYYFERDAGTTLSEKIEAAVAKETFVFK
jgi:hypothetical protein